MSSLGKTIFCKVRKGLFALRTCGKGVVVTGVHITEDDDDDKLSIIDIKAAIAEQGIPVSDLYSKQDLVANADVLTLVHEAEMKTKATITKENVILQAKNKDLKAFKDKTDTLSLIKTSKEFTDKNARTIEYIEDRLATGRGVDLSGDLTDEQRQDKVNVAIKEELELMTRQGITFKAKETKDSDKKPFGPDEPEEADMTNPEENPLIPQEKEEKKE